MSGAPIRATASIRTALVFVAAAASLTGAAVLTGTARQAARAEYPATPAAGPADGADVVLVLGYPARRDGSPGAMQRWRVAVAVRSAPPGALFVLTGGAVHGPRAEADALAALAVARGVDGSRIVRERRAASTIENLRFTRPWLSPARTIRIASSPFHARRARRYLHDLHPDLYPRLRPTRDGTLRGSGPFGLALLAYDAMAAVVSARRDRADPSRLTRRRRRLVPRASADA